MALAQNIRKFVPTSLRPFSARVYHRLRARRSKVESARGELIAILSDTSRFANVVARVDCTIYPEDGMFQGDAAHYLGVGLSALRCIPRPTCTPSTRSDPPCGAGRVLRFLVPYCERANITGCDLDEQAVDFCAGNFGVNCVYSKPEISEVRFERKFDLIWVGSLVTHLSAAYIEKLLELLADNLTDNGLLVFTTHGESVTGRLIGGSLYGLTAQQSSELIAAYEQNGFGFEAYQGPPAAEGAEPTPSDYGVSITSPLWIRETAGRIGVLSEVYFRERGWDDHQDVFGFVKTKS
jgi:hypothetical protein